MAIIKKKLSDNVIEEIRRMLKAGELKEGDKLPDQNKFAKQLGVSRLSLREALNYLQMIGVIEQKPRVGTIIISGNPDFWINRMQRPLISDSKTTLELIEARNFIELSIANLAFKKITVEEISILENQLEIMINCSKPEDHDEYVKADILFHKTLAYACGNRYLLGVFNYIYQMMDEFMKEFFHLIPSSKTHSIKMHKMIYKSLLDNNEKKYIHYIKSHLDTIENCLTEYYKEQNELQD
ncbi:MAG: FadR/GntR family transcriptional regulator [Acetivibrionales bacterium]|jgi:GntR family transcriptional repressor for pyruvate dehydrogenase complex